MINAICVGRISKIDKVAQSLDFGGGKTKTVFCANLVYVNSTGGENYVTIEFWDRSFDKFKQYHHVGDLIQVFGNVKVKPYSGKDGSPRATLVIVNPVIQKFKYENADNGTLAPEEISSVTPIDEGLDF